MAAAIGEKPGETIGYATRLDSKVGKSTRVIAMTHGVFLSRIEADPELAGVSAVLFDEVHERSLDNDLALAFALDAATALRPDLRIIAMSATLDVDRFQRLLDDPPTIVSEGKSFPLDIQYAGRDAAARIEPQMASAIRAALAEHRRFAPRLPARRRRDRTDGGCARQRFPAMSTCTSFTAPSSPPRSEPRSPHRRPVAASSSSRPASPKPASRSMTCGSSSTAALRGGRATIVARA